MRASARFLGIALAVGAGAALMLGVGLALAQQESVLQWIAYMFSIAGAVTVAFACFSGAPTSARKHLVRRIRKSDDEPAVVETAMEKPFASELVVLVTAGLLLIAAGTGVELLL